MKAFPSIDPVYKNDIVEMKVSFGMDLRDYFAAKAMQAVAVIHSHERDVARNAYKIADAMMEAREK
jgi:hypothetical protein